MKSRHRGALHDRWGMFPFLARSLSSGRRRSQSLLASTERRRVTPFQAKTMALRSVCCREPFCLTFRRFCKVVYRSALRLQHREEARVVSGQRVWRHVSSCQASCWEAPLLPSRSVAGGPKDGQTPRFWLGGSLQRRVGFCRVGTSFGF